MKHGSLGIGMAVIAGGSLALVAASLAPNFGDPLAGLASSEMNRFNDGKAEFQSVETVADGLGPVFNDVSCASCHLTPAVGGAGARLVTRFGTMKPDGTFDPMAGAGGSLIQSQGIGPVGTCNYLSEIVPPEATVVTGRRTTPLFGLGLIEAVPARTFLELAVAESLDPDGTGGIPSIVTDVSTGLPAIGRFGWKAQVPTLHQFAGDAYLNEMGITTPQFPNENCPQGNCASLSCNPRPDLNDGDDAVQALADYMTMLAPPPRAATSGNGIQLGEGVFTAIGCAGCHRANLKTGASPIHALSNVTFHPYSDFLLHDMGSLGDGITQNHATGRLMRTAPLWGLRKEPTLLHDGRAATIEQAILAHDGQGKRSRDRFAALSAPVKALVISFLSSL
jgi:CxxC motif-containing protein (DUF1111 family)